MQASLSFALSVFTPAYYQIQKDLNREEKKFTDELVLELVKFLKILCSKGRELQSTIASTPNMLAMINEIIIGKNYSEVSRNVQIKSFQLVANLCVDNIETQEIIWDFMGSVIKMKLECDDKDFVNVAAMILHCMVLSNHSKLNQLELLKTSLSHFKLFLEEPSNVVPDFIHILLDHLICTNPNALDLYNQLEAEGKKMALYYIHDYVDIESNE